MFNKPFQTNKLKFDKLKARYIAAVEQRMTTTTNDDQKNTNLKLQQLIADITSWSAATVAQLETSKQNFFTSYTTLVLKSPTMRLPSRYRHIRGPAAMTNIPFAKQECKDVVMECWDAFAALDHKIRNALQSNGITVSLNEFPTGFTGDFDVPSMKGSLHAALDGIVDIKPANQQRIPALDEAKLIYVEKFKPICQKIEDRFKDAKKTMAGHVDNCLSRSKKQIPNEFELNASVKLLNDSIRIRVECTKMFMDKFSDVEASLSPCMGSDSKLNTVSGTIDCLESQLDASASDGKSLVIENFDFLNDAIVRAEFEIVSCTMED